MARNRPKIRAPLGEGSRFEALKESLAGNPKIRNPGAVAASIGRKKYGTTKFQKLASAGRKSAE